MPDTPTAPASKEPQIRPFGEFLTQQANGRTHAELSESLHELIAAVKETGKGGTITYQVEIKPLSKGDDLTLTVTDKVVIKLPKGERAHSVFFVDDDGNLIRNDPRQATLPLRDVEDRRTRALRDAGGQA